MIGNDRGPQRAPKADEQAGSQAVGLVAIVVGTKSAFTLRVITMQPGFLFNLESVLSR